MVPEAKGDAMNGKVWGGRFREQTDGLVHRFQASLDFDRRLYPQDIEGSQAHCRMLARQRILSEEEARRICHALDEIRQELDGGAVPAGDTYEDIHSYVERALVERLGPLGEKIHTGRSRNDQVALDVRLYVREATDRVLTRIRRVQRALVSLAEKYQDCIMPGYTHMQRAQPILLAHHLMAYYEMLQRDNRRFTDSLGRVQVLPLGSAALAGSTFDLDPESVARELGFTAVAANSMDAVSDRDFVLEFLFNASVLMMHLSRLSEELIIWSTQEFAFVSIAEAFCTGSSIMPQKKNPDVPELIRGKTGRVYGHLMGLLTTMKGLPLTYNKDMQEDKEGLFDTEDTVVICLEVLAGLLAGLTFDRQRLRQAAEGGFLVATDLADYLVGRGMTFREAHAVVGRMVLAALEQNVELSGLSLPQMKAFAPQIDSDVYEWLDAASAVRRRRHTGATGHEQVLAQIRKAKEAVGL